MSKESFLKVEERFHLPPATLLSFSLDTGGFSRYMTYDSANSSKVKRIGSIHVPLGDATSVTDNVSRNRDQSCSEISSRELRSLPLT